MTFMGMPLYYDFGLLLFIAPALILAMIAQWWVHSAYSKGLNAPASMSGFAAARRILDAAGLQKVAIESIPGQMSDHYDPRDKVLRLSGDVYHGRTLTAVGIAAHEAGHAVQDAVGYLPLVVRNLAVPAASFGSGASMFLLILGVAFNFKWLLLLGIICFSAVVLFQVVNLPVEFNASSRAKALLVEEGIVHQFDMGPVNNVLNAAALTYVAATLQAILTLLYYVMRFAGGSRDDR
jgi:Zn-dependent membrane protease YugP